MALMLFATDMPLLAELGVSCGLHVLQTFGTYGADKAPLGAQRL